MTDDDATSAAALGRRLLLEVGSAALATLDGTGAPFASHVTVAPAADRSPLLLLSRLAIHTRNLERDGRSSLLFVREPEDGAGTLAATRLTVAGRISRDDAGDHRRRFLARHPDAEHYAGFGDFAVYRFEIGSGHLVAGFGRIAALSPADLLSQAAKA